MPSLRQHYRRVTGRTAAFAPEPALESIYRDLFLRELAALGEEDRFFPTGGAANYSLLYLILRIGREFEPASVLDVGAGQTSLLWAMLQRRGLVGRVVTLEDDPEWGARIAAQVTHDVVVTPLGARTIAGRSVATYDWDAVRAGGGVRRDGVRRTARYAHAFAVRHHDDAGRPARRLRGRSG